MSGGRFGKIRIWEKEDQQYWLHSGEIEVFQEKKETGSKWDSEFAFSPMCCAFSPSNFPTKILVVGSPQGLKKYVLIAKFSKNERNVCKCYNQKKLLNYTVIHV